MEPPLRLPLLVNVPSRAALIFKGMPNSRVSSSKWIADNTDILADLQRNAVSCGCNAVVVPTNAANRRRLLDYGLQHSVYDINKRIVSSIKDNREFSNIYVGATVGIKEAIGAKGTIENFDLLCEIYFEQIKALKDAGADFLLSEGQLVLENMRACSIVANSLNIPLITSIYSNSEGYTSEGTKLLSAVLTLESLGAYALGIDSPMTADKINLLLSEISDFCSLPLIIKPKIDPNINMEKFKSHIKKSLDFGVRIVSGSFAEKSEICLNLAEVLSEYKFKKREVDKRNINACTTAQDAFFIGENIKLTKPIKCGYDLCEEIINAEKDDGNVILINLDTEDDVKGLIANSDIIRMPICVSSHNKKVLELAVRYFQGRIIVDKTCGLSDAFLNELSSEYGSILY